MRAPRTRGGVMSVEILSLGWFWQPYRYTRTDAEGREVLPLPHKLLELARTIATEAARLSPEIELPEDYTPDAALVNWYAPGARMGMHQDRDERSSAPVVSLSVGNTGLFRLGNTQNRSRPYHDVELRSGDAFVFGGPARLAYHGVPRVLPTPHAVPGLAPGRLNLTLRMTGLSSTAHSGAAKRPPG